VVEVSRQQITNILKPKSVSMKTKSFTSAGSLHPILFFAVVYVVALLFSIFICSALFYSCNAKSADLTEQHSVPLEKQVVADNNLALK